MTVTLVSGSNIALTTGTETTLTTVGRQGRFQLVTDLSNYLAGDEVDFRIYAMVTPTGTARVLEFAGYMGAQPTDDMVKLSSVIPNDQTDAQALKFTATQSRGTSRSLLWKVLDVSDEPTNWFNLLVSSLGHVSNVDLVGQVTGSVNNILQPVVTSAVQGGFVTVSGAVIANVQSLVGVSGTVIASVVQGGFVTVSGVVTAGNVTGSVFGNVNGNILGNVNGSVNNVIQPVVASAVQGGVVAVSGTVVASAVQGGLVTVSGSVVAGTVLDKVNYFLGSPQQYDRIGNTTGSTQGNITLVVTGAATFDPSTVWSFTGTRSLNGNQFWNLYGFVGQVTGSVMSVVSGTAANFDPSTVWNFTGSRNLSNPQVWNLIGNISGTFSPPLQVSVSGVTIDYSQVWGFPTRTLTNNVFNAPPVVQGNNLNITRGDTFIWAPTNLGSLANLSKLYFSIKRIYADLDSEAEVQVEKTAGLVTINRQPATNPLNGSIVVNDVNLGNITITVQAVETAKLDTLMNIFYDVQFINTSGTVTTLVSGPVTIIGDATRNTGP